LIDGIGNRFGPLEGPRKPPQPASPPPSAPNPSSPAAPPAAPDRFQASRPLGAFELPPAPFDAADADAPTAEDWRTVAVATRQTGLGATLDRLAADVARRDPAGAEGLPLLFDAPSGHRASARRTIDVARRLAAQGWRESAASVAVLAAESATPAERPVLVAAAQLADRMGARPEASHVLFRLAQAASTPEDALAAARRSLRAGYPENAKYAYYRAAVLSPTPAGALAAAGEASAAGLAFEAGEPAFQRWREGQDRMYRALEGPPAGPSFASASPYAAGAMPRPAFLNPYLVAMRKAPREALGGIARAATLAGEGATAALAWRRLRETAG
jgi:hypothetical protein